ncbi:hypothetical protein TNCV_2157861 [Trichonephila clavipes]|nr:hypothetical protein TNCV_2157861 [Trichonephila clavipes]
MDGWMGRSHLLSRRSMTALVTMGSHWLPLENPMKPTLIKVIFPLMRNFTPNIPFKYWKLVLVPLKFYFLESNSIGLTNDMGLGYFTVW